MDWWSWVVLMRQPRSHLRDPARPQTAQTPETFGNINCEDRRGRDGLVGACDEKGHSSIGGRRRAVSVDDGRDSGKAGRELGAMRQRLVGSGRQRVPAVLSTAAVSGMRRYRLLVGSDRQYLLATSDTAGVGGLGLPEHADRSRRIAAALYDDVNNCWYL